MLVKYVDSKKDQWEKFLDTCVYAYNTSIHESTKFSPFELMFGRKAVLPISIDTGKSDPAVVLTEYNGTQAISPSSVQRAVKQRNAILEEAKANIAAAQQKKKKSNMIESTAHQVLTVNVLSSMMVLFLKLSTGLGQRCR